VSRTAFLLLLPLLAGVPGCPPPDGETPLLDQGVAVEPMKFFRFDFHLEFARNYRLVVAPAGGDVDVIVRSGPSLGMMVVGDEPPPGSENVRDGTTRELRGELPGGAATVNVLNRGAATVRVKCQLFTSKPPESGAGK
jgi:hypothetical protein